MGVQCSGGVRGTATWPLHGTICGLWGLTIGWVVPCQLPPGSGGVVGCSGEERAEFMEL